eukprot:scaffold81063_cov33-Tisochrysis_lutea.AAC.4
MLSGGGVEGRGACALTCNLEPPARDGDEGSFLSTKHMPTVQTETEAGWQLQCFNKVIREVCKPHAEAPIHITHENMLVAAHSR